MAKIFVGATLVLPQVRRGCPKNDNRGLVGATLVVALLVGVGNHKGYPNWLPTPDVRYKLIYNGLCMVLVES